MTQYRYRAVHPSGRIHRGDMTVANENELVHFLNESGLELIEARPRAPARLPAVVKKLRERIGLRPRALLCRQLADLLRAGLPFLAALQGVTSALPQGPWRDRLEAVARGINQGSPVAAAFGRHPDMFNPVFLAILKAGETGGDLAVTFVRLAEHVEWQARLKEKVSRALRYPLFLLCVALGVTAFMMIMVVPQVMAFLSTIAGDLPFLTRLLIKLSQLFAEGWWIALLAVVAVSLAVLFARRHSEAFALCADGWLLKIPGLGATLRKLAVARFAHSFALLLQGGADLPLALHTAKGVLGNRALMAAAAEAERQVQAGQALSAATGVLFPPSVTQMIRVGEQSGRLVATLGDVTRAYDAEAQATVESFIGALEPALTILVGALLAWVVLAVLGPVYGSLGKLSMVP